MAETQDKSFDSWFLSITFYMPSESCPEVWLLNAAQKNIPVIAKTINSSEDDLTEAFLATQGIDPHNIFHEVSKHLGIDRSSCIQLFVSALTQACDPDIKTLNSKIAKALEEAG